MMQRRYIFEVLLCALWLAPPARAQDNEFSGLNGNGEQAVDATNGDHDNQGNPSLDRATPNDDFSDINDNVGLEGGNTSGNSGNDSPATDDGGQFDLEAPKANGNSNLFNGVAAPNQSANGQAQGHVTEPPPAAATNAALTPQLNTPASSPSVAAPPMTAPSEAATGQEDLVPKVGAVPIEAPPLPPPNEFAGAPPIPGTLRLMAEGEAPEEYVVEPGDNLYDICDQLLDEAAYWPKLWALNPEIKNPHFIFPNMRLRFYAGDDDTPPYLQVVTEDDVIPIDKGVLDESQLIAEKVFFPQNSPAAEYVVEVIGPEQVDLLQDEIFTGGRAVNLSEKQVQVPGFIYGKEREALGVIDSGREGESNVGAGGRVFVEAESTVSKGNLYSILRYAGEVEDPSSGDFVGYRYYFVANLRINRLTEDRYFSGLVQDSQLGVAPGDLVVSYVSTRRSVPLDDTVGPTAGVSAHIVAWEQVDKEVGGRGEIAMIDRGSNGGVTVGSYVSVYGTPGYVSLSSGDKGLPLDYELIGSMRIIDVTDVGASGYVVRSTDPIRIGDRTGKN